MKADLYDAKGVVVGSIEAPDTVFALKWNANLMHQALQAYENNKRKPLAHAKGRGEVSGGGKKPWKQKGTGRARVGSNRSPIWKGGGVTHGPLKEKNYTQILPKKMARKATAIALSQKIRDKELKFIDHIEFVEAKTKNTVLALKPFADLKKKNQILLIIPEKKEALKRSIRNLEAANWVIAGDLNAKTVIMYKQVLIFKDALPLVLKQYKTV